MRDAFEAYTLFKKHPEATATAQNFTEFCKLANLAHLEKYAGGWIDRAFNTFKAGKETLSPLYFPAASKFSELFEAAYLIETNSKNKPVGVIFLGGNDGFSRHLGGRRGWSERTPDTRSHYGAKFYGTYVKPTRAMLDVCGPYHGQYSFEAIRRTDGILITVHTHAYIGSTWLALLDLSEDIRAYFDDETRAMLAAERQAEFDAWGNTKL